MGSDLKAFRRAVRTAARMHAVWLKGGVPKAQADAAYQAAVRDARKTYGR